MYGAGPEDAGMLLVAVPRRCPVFGGRVKSFDAAAVRNRPGVRHVLAVGEMRSPWSRTPSGRPRTALDALPVEWDGGENAARLLRHHRCPADRGLDAAEAFVGNSQGDARGAIAGAARKVEAVYSYPFQNHGPWSR